MLEIFNKKINVKAYNTAFLFSNLVVLKISVLRIKSVPDNANRNALK